MDERIRQTGMQIEHLADQIDELLMPFEQETEKDPAVRDGTFFCALLLCAGRRVARYAAIKKDGSLEQLISLSTAGYEQAIRSLALSIQPPR